MTTTSRRRTTGRQQGDTTKPGNGHRMSFDHLAGATLSDSCRAAFQSMTAKEAAASWDRAFARTRQPGSRASGNRSVAASWDRAFGHPSTSTR
ncbi:hypothetical protein JHL17_34090 [Azospirillum sp. YIM B02556]|uniref:Uncharacterized protein n=1 Tax=Azospirillum endophyticum TaxID=2800326 RepID=A0ABS1FG81_9PROT|nr:hypothetical protein [Azospirillum endophyticum]MBK1842438.1 hypothetical protein [Azospirillum endophyticum]